MILKLLSIVLFFLFIPYGIAGQSNSKIGDWKSYLPYQSGIELSQSDDKIYYGTPWALIIIDKEDFSVEFLSKVEGLSDVGISKLKYDPFNKQLIVAYNNSNIDIITQSGVINVPNIFANNNIFGDKGIYDIYIANSRYAYLSTGFGVVELDIKNIEFGFTAFTEVRVNQVLVQEDRIYAATDEGIYSADYNGVINLGDFNNWSFMEGDNGLPLLYEVSHILEYDESIYALIDGDIWKAQEEIFELFYPYPQGYEAVFISSEGNNLLYGIRDNISKSKLIAFNESGVIENIDSSCSNYITYALEDASQRIWLGDEWNQIRFKNSFSESCQRIDYNSPYSHHVSEIDIKDNKVFVVSGGATDAFGDLFRRSGFYIFDGVSWSNFNENNISTIKENDLISFLRVAAHPANEKVYFGTFWGGILEWDFSNNQTQLFDDTNSSLQGAMGDEARERITSLSFDEDNNLWISNYNAPNPISVLTADGTWHNFEVISGEKLSQLAIDESNFKWCVVTGINGGLVVLDNNNTISDPTDDRQKFFNISNSAITTNLINCIEVDLDGDVWVGTSEGPVVFECGSSVFDASCQGSKRKVLQDSIVAFLLENENINTIAVDGANRKWFGSRNGIFVQSPSGEVEIFRYTIDNSPLFDNNVIDMKFDPETGEMFIATDKGLQSIRTETTSGGRFHKNDIYAYPNPVRPDYIGPIAIKGLAQNSNVKITDIKGRLIYETTALGGQAIWDGNDFSGRRAAAGVYLVFSTSDASFDNPDTAVTKILIVH